MAYTTGSRLTQANPAEDMYNLIAAAFTAHAAYEFVETWVVTTATHHVWKCKGALNSMGADYFLVFSRLNAAGSLSLNVALCEQYNATTHVISKAVPTITSTAATPQADGTFTAATTTLSTQTTSETNVFRAQATGSTSAYDYWLITTNDGFWFGTRVGSSNYGFLVSTYDKLITPASADVFPVVLMGTGTSASESTSSIAGGCTRHPLVTTSQARMWGVRALLSAGSVLAWTSPMNVYGASVGNPGSLYQEGRPLASRVAVVNWATVTTYSSAATGDVRGLFRNLLISQATAAVVMGDTITVGSDVYVHMGTGTTYTTWYNTSAA